MADQRHESAQHAAVTQMFEARLMEQVRLGEGAATAHTLVATLWLHRTLATTCLESPAPHVEHVPYGAGVN